MNSLTFGYMVVLEDPNTKLACTSEKRITDHRLEFFSREDYGCDWWLPPLISFVMFLLETSCLQYEDHFRCSQEPGFPLSVRVAVRVSVCFIGCTSTAGRNVLTTMTFLSKGFSMSYQMRNPGELLEGKVGCSQLLFLAGLRRAPS